MYTSIFGYLGGIILSINLVPQIIKSIKTKSTTDLSWFMFLINIVGFCFYGTYGILIHSIPIWSTVIVSLIETSLLMSLKLYYDRRDTFTRRESSMPFSPSHKTNGNSSELPSVMTV